MSEQQASHGGLCFITSGSLADFKSKKNMTIVRKKAMSSFLKEKNSTAPKDRSRLNSDASDVSYSSNGSSDTNPQASVAPSATTQQLTVPVIFRHDQQDIHTERQLSRMKNYFDSVLPPPPIVLPMRIHVKLPYDETTPPPLVSIGKSLDPFRTMFQASDPHISVEELKFHCSRFFGTRGMGQHWIPAIVTHPHTFLSTLCLASTHHDIIHEKPVESLATTALCQEVIHLVGQNLLDVEEWVADHNIITVTQLISAEVMARKEASLAWHEAGLERMINLRGGLSRLGMKGHLASTASWVSLVSAILREAKPRAMYADYCASHSSMKYSLTMTIPESPIFHPLGRFVTLQRSSKCRPQTLKLINDIWMMIDRFLYESKQSHHNSQIILNLYKQITNGYKPVSELRKTSILTEDDWKYEAIRITAIVQATAIVQRIPLSKALSRTMSFPDSELLHASSAAFLSNNSALPSANVRQDIPALQRSTSQSYSTYSISPPVNAADVLFDFQDSWSLSTQTAFGASRPFSSSTRLPSDSSFTVQPPVSTLSSSSSILRALKDALDKSNLSYCWSDMAGVLAWIGLVMGAASRNNENKVLKKHFSAFAMRTSITLCFDHPEAIHSTVLRMGEVIDGLGHQSSTGLIKQGRANVGKKRKT